MRTRQKKAVNPFPIGQALMKKAHAVGVHFSYSNRMSALLAFRASIPNQPDIKIQVDLNGTRVAAQHGLLYSEMRLNRLLRVYMTANRLDGMPYLNEQEWVSLSEFEAVLDITKSCTTTMQYEELFTAAFNILIKQMTLRRLRLPQILVVDMEKVTAMVCAMTLVINCALTWVTSRLLIFIECGMWLKWLRTLLVPSRTSQHSQSPGKSAYNVHNWRLRGGFAAIARSKLQWGMWR